MPILYINTGTAPNQGNGDSLRLSFTKINNNFALLENMQGSSSSVYTPVTPTNWLGSPTVGTVVSALDELAGRVHTVETTPVVNTDVYKFQYGVIGTKDNPDTGGWGGSAIVLDPGGESWAGIYIPSVSQQDGGGSLNIYNNKAVGNNIQLSVNAGSFTFNGDGTLAFPVQPTNQRTGTGDALKFAKSSNQKVIATAKGTVDSATVERLVIAGGDAYQDPDTGIFPAYSEGGDVYLWAGRGANGGDVKVDAGNSQGVNGEEGGTVKVRGGYSNTGQGGFVHIEAGSSNQGQGGDVRITAGSGGTGGAINLSAYGTTQWNNWQFNSDGSLTLPPGQPILFGNGNSRIQAGMGFHINSEEGISLEAVDVTDPENPVTKGWYFGTDGTITFPSDKIKAPISSNISIETGTLPTDPPTTIVISGADFSPVNLTYIKDGANSIWYPAGYNPANDPYIEFTGGQYGIRVPGFGQALYVNTGTLNIPLAQWNTNPPLGSVAPIGEYTYPSTYSHSWRFGAAGGLTFPDATVQSTAYTGTYTPATPSDWIGSPTVGTVVSALDELSSRVHASGVPAVSALLSPSSTEIDLTKTVIKLTATDAGTIAAGTSYHLADGYDGQIIHVVAASGTIGGEYTSVVIDHFRSKDAEGNMRTATPGTTDNGGTGVTWTHWLPFSGAGTSASTLVTLIFANGYWSLPHGRFA